MLRAYPISELQQLLRTGTDRFRARFGHPWLVWEPGTWQVGSPFEQTILPEDAAEDASLRRGDPLAFALDLSAGPQYLRAGRATDCDMVINDATVSREHLALTRDSNLLWRAEALTEAYTFCREPMKVGEPVSIVGGDQLRVGAVLLTFYSPVGLVERLGG
jgi:hypothetical protein